jgi:hypothetical protein
VQSAMEKIFLTKKWQILVQVVIKIGAMKILNIPLPACNLMKCIQSLVAKIAIRKITMQRNHLAMDAMMIIVIQSKNQVSWLVSNIAMSVRGVCDEAITI